MGSAVREGGVDARRDPARQISVSLDEVLFGADVRGCGDELLGLGYRRGERIGEHYDLLWSKYVPLR